MTIYLTETELVRALATELYRAANDADEIAASVALALGLSELESTAVQDAIVLSERLDRVAHDLRGHSLDVHELDRAPVVNLHEVQISANRT